MSKKVMVGMSGGVDSSVAALLLKEAGYEVIGVTMRLCSEAEEAIRDAHHVSEQLGIRHIVVDLREAFRREVMDYFVEEYLQGHTPNPCVRCNQRIKFGEFLKTAEMLGAEFVATGHYVRLDRNETGPILLCAKDERKDQTYFLSRVQRDVFERTLFPLGEYTKASVREIAKKAALNTHSKSDSEEICFIPSNDHGKFIECYRPESMREGNIVSSRGEVLGTHRGIANYTVGQRRGLGVATGKRVYVSDIRPETNEVVLDDVDAILKTALIAGELNLLSTDLENLPIRLSAKIRSTARPEPVAIKKLDRERIQVCFERPQKAVVAGQTLALYDGEIVVGGALILGAG